MPTKASSPTKNKGKVFFVAKSSGPLLGRLPPNPVPYQTLFVLLVELFVDFQGITHWRFQGRGLGGPLPPPPISRSASGTVIVNP